MAVVRKPRQVDVVIAGARPFGEEELDDRPVTGAAVRRCDRAAERRPARRPRERIGACVDEHPRHGCQSVRRAPGPIGADATRRLHATRSNRYGGRAASRDSDRVAVRQRRDRRCRAATRLRSCSPRSLVCRQACALRGRGGRLRSPRRTRRPCRRARPCALSRLPRDYRGSLQSVVSIRDSLEPDVSQRQDAAGRDARADLVARAAAPLRAVGAVRVAADRGPRSRGESTSRCSRRPTRSRRARLVGTCTDRVLGGSGARREGLGGAAHLGGVRAGRRVRPDPQQLRLPAADATAASSTRRSSRRSTASRRSGSCRSSRSTTTSATTWRSATPTGTRRLDYVATIHHGIDMDEFELGRRRRRLPPVLRRIHPDKGTAEAIDVAERAGMPLMIAGIVQDRDYFERFVEPRLDGERVSYVGPGRRRPPRRPCSAARARSCTSINFDEPFGFSVVEAMACGTPVIAQPRGSMPEIVRDGENGFLVDTLDEAVARRAMLRRRSTAPPCARRSSSRFDVEPDGRRLPRAVLRVVAHHRGRARERCADPRCAGSFRLGVNYWPARTAMGWWSSFDPAEVATDFARIAARRSRLGAGVPDLGGLPAGPGPTSIAAMLDRLVTVADLAGRARACARAHALHRSHERRELDSGVGARRVGRRRSLPRHRPAARSSKPDCATGTPTRWSPTRRRSSRRRRPPPSPATRRSGRGISATRTRTACVPPSTIVGASVARANRRPRSAAPTPRRSSRSGLHMEDLEEDRRLGPREAADVCDFLSMHGYPIYAAWADRSDRRATASVPRPHRPAGSATGATCCSREFGLPTYRRGDRSDARRALLVDEDAAAAYTASALAALRAAGCLGAMLWCYSDYDPARLGEPAARSRSARALVRALASRRLAESRRSPRSRRSSEPTRCEPGLRRRVDRHRSRRVSARPRRAAAAPLPPVSRPASE